jgi:hypothetical protein
MSLICIKDETLASSIDKNTCLEYTPEECDRSNCETQIIRHSVKQLNADTIQDQFRKQKAGHGGSCL